MTNDPIDDKEGAVADGLLLEESSDDHDGSAGLELDARQSAEIRQIFLTTLPDYLEPMREMIARLSSEPDESGDVRHALAKTIASIVDAASRVNLDDVARSMEALREDVMLLGDGDEPQQALRERITKAFEALANLSGPRGDAVPLAHSETIVSASRGIEGIDAAALQKLMAAGVVYVEQLLDADPKDVVAVSGLDANTVARLAGALKERATHTPATDAPKDVQQAIHALVDEELSVEQMRGDALRLRLTMQALRADITGLERQCQTLRAALADAREGVAERATVLGEIEIRSAALERDRGTTETELEKVAARLAALQSERNEAMEELGHMAGDAASLSERLTRILDPTR